MTATSRQAPRPGGTGLVTDDRYARHTLGGWHPESPERLNAIRRRVRESGLASAVTTLVPSVDPGSYIRMVHPDWHIRSVALQAHDESICRLAVSGVLSAVDAVCLGEVRNAFCAVRPPGHHASDTGEFGFCFYNNAAIAARYAQKKHGL